MEPTNNTDPTPTPRESSKCPKCERGMEPTPPCESLIHGVLGDAGPTVTHTPKCPKCERTSGPFTLCAGCLDFVRGMGATCHPNHGGCGYGSNVAEFLTQETAA